MINAYSTALHERLFNLKHTPPRNVRVIVSGSETNKRRVIKLGLAYPLNATNSEKSKSCVTITRFCWRANLRISESSVSIGKTCETLIMSHPCWCKPQRSSVKDSYQPENGVKSSGIPTLMESWKAGLKPPMRHTSSSALHHQPPIPDRL